MTKRILVYEQTGQTAWLEVNTNESRPARVFDWEYTVSSNRVYSRLDTLSRESGLVAVDGYDSENSTFVEGFDTSDPKDRINYAVEVLKEVPNIWKVKVIEI